MKHYNPTSPARRQMESIEWKKILSGVRPTKSLVSGFYRARARNNVGRITTRHKGGGAKRLWREVDFLYNKKDMPARIMSLEYDPNRTSLIALVQYRDGTKRYVLASRDMKVGNEIITSESAALEVGNRVPIGKIPVGMTVFNIELYPGHGAQMARSAGVGAVVLAQEQGYTLVELPSKEVRKVRVENWASIGSLSNHEHGLVTGGNAGRSRHRGIRPTVRGSVMNPVDHPHGGGEGRTQRGRRRGPATPWGKPARGVRTRHAKKKSSKFIISRRKK